MRGWAAGESSVAVRDISQRKLCGPPGDESSFGTGMIPKALLVGKSSSHGAADALDTIRVRHKSGGISELTFKSYEQGRSKGQGATLDFVWFDEEPSLEIYIEGLARIAATKGMSFLTFAPLNGFNRVVPRFLREVDPGFGAGGVVGCRILSLYFYILPDRLKVSAAIPGYSADHRAVKVRLIPRMLVTHVLVHKYQ